MIYQSTKASSVDGGPHCWLAAGFLLSERDLGALSILFSLEDEVGEGCFRFLGESGERKNSFL